MEFQTRYCCNLWPEWMPWAFQIADGLIFLSYMTIPFWLVVIWIRRRDLIPQPSMALMFAGFILTCGLTHAFGIVVWFVAWYRFYVVMLMVCSTISVITALRMRGLARHVLLLPRQSELENLSNRVTMLTEELERNRNDPLSPEIREKISAIQAKLSRLK